VVDEALSIDGQAEARAIAVEIVLSHAKFFHYGRQHLMNHPHALQLFVHVDVAVNLQRDLLNGCRKNLDRSLATIRLGSCHV
jgi:hypothetical protein